MTFSIFLLALKDIIFNPVKAWETIDLENRSVKSIRNNYLFPLVLLVSVSAFFGSLLYTNAELAPVYSVFSGIKCFILFYFSVNCTAYILKEITYPLDLGKDFAISFRLIVFSITPFLLCQVLSRFFESLLFVNVLSLYSLYIFWIGAERVLTPPAYKKMPLLIATAVTFAGIYITTNLLLTMLIDRIFYKLFV